MEVEITLRADFSGKVALETLERLDSKPLDELEIGCVIFRPKKPFRIGVDFGSKKILEEEKKPQPKKRGKRKKQEKQRVRIKDVHHQIDVGSRLVKDAFGGFTVSAKTLVSFVDEKGLMKGVSSHTGKLSRVYAMMDKLKEQGLARERSRGSRNTRRWYVKQTRKPYRYAEKTDEEGDW